MIYILMTLVSSFTFATTPINHQYTTSTQFESKGIDLREPNFVDTYIDYVRDEIQVNFMFHPCPPNPGHMTCRAMPMPTDSFRAQIQSIEVGECGEVTIKGIAMEGLLNGPSTTITVVDYAKYNCLVAVPASTTEVTYSSGFEPGVAPTEKWLSTVNFPLSPAAE